MLKSYGVHTFCLSKDEPFSSQPSVVALVEYNFLLDNSAIFPKPWYFQGLQLFLMMFFHPFYQQPKKGAAKPPAGSAGSRKATFKKICGDFDDYCDISKGGLEHIVQELDLNAGKTFVEIAGSLVALYVAFHSNVSKSSGVESNADRHALVTPWAKQLNKNHSDIFFLAPFAADVRSVRHISSLIGSANYVFVNTTLMEPSDVVQIMDLIASHLKDDATLLVTDNPWPRPSNFRPAPLELYKKQEVPNGDVGNGKMTLFYFQVLNGPHKSQLSPTQLKSVESRGRRHTDIYVPSNSAATATPNARGKAKVVASSSAQKARRIPQAILDALLTDDDEEDLPVQKRATKGKRSREEDVDSEFEEPPKKIKKVAPVAASPAKKTQPAAASPAKKTQSTASPAKKTQPAAAVAASPAKKIQPAASSAKKSQSTASPAKKTQSAAAAAAAAASPAKKTQPTIKSPSSHTKSSPPPSASSPVAAKKSSSAKSPASAAKSSTAMDVDDEEEKPTPTKQQHVAQPSGSARPKGRAPVNSPPGRNAKKVTVPSTTEETVLEKRSSPFRNPTATAVTSAPVTVPTRIAPKKTAGTPKRSATPGAKKTATKNRTTSAADDAVSVENPTASDDNAMDVSTSPQPAPQGWLGWLFGWGNK
jgi:hypothetical protein